jgi:hypothetical protein
MIENKADITARLYLRGVNLEPNFITELLKLEPARIQRKGAVMSKRHPSKLFDFGLWVWKSELKSYFDISR